jgi:hypothetical protein
MNRPERITEEDLKRWDSIVEQDSFSSSMMIMFSKLKEMMRAGLWLAEMLDKLGAEEQEIKNIQFSFGQKSLYISSDDILWKLAQETIENYKKGIVDVPGEKLAQELIAKNTIPKSKIEKNILN